MTDKQLTLILYCAVAFFLGRVAGVLLVQVAYWMSR